MHNTPNEQPRLITESHPHYDQLAQRVGPMHLRLRLGIESDHVSEMFGQGINLFHFENMQGLHYMIKLFLKSTFLYQRGKRNALNLQIHQQEIVSPRIPSLFDGFRILHCSDLHIDMNNQLEEVLIRQLEAVEYDLCVITGDIKFRTDGSERKALNKLERVRKHIHKPVLAVLGNHDFIHMTPLLEAMDIQVLMNENSLIERNEQRIVIAGVDDPHFYLADNLERATQGLTGRDYSILLAHSPEVFRKASYCGFDLLLCGHTHGGQICAPGGHVLYSNARIPRSLARGKWQYRSMDGYTSCGIGSSSIDVRFNCPPELVIHTLRTNHSQSTSSRSA